MSDDQRKSEPRPVILTKTEALAYAADKLDRMATDCELAAIIFGALKGKPHEGDAQKHMRELQQLLPEPEMQMIALRAGAKAIRDLALEERLVAAKAQANGIKETA